MQRILSTTVIAFFLTCSPASIARDDGLAFHEDYYLGFSQGVYYGLMLAGVEYDVAWCVKAELAYEAEGIGAGGDFQQAMEKILRDCQERYPAVLKN
jgi:hypothetical protein